MAATALYLQTLPLNGCVACTSLLKPHQIPLKAAMIVRRASGNFRLQLQYFNCLSKAEPRQRKHSYLWSRSCEGISEIRKVSP